MEAKRTPALRWAGASLMLTVVTLGLGCSLPAQPSDKQPQGEPSTFEIKGLGSFRLSGPYSHSNLSVYLIHGEDKLTPEVEFIILQEAMEAKLIVVYETDNVNQLSVENRSGKHVFIQAGDILRGGKQDRVIAYDLVLEPKPGKVRIGSFCVEPGRWSGRGSEPVGYFNSGAYVASGKALKRAARESKSQAEVWEKVKVMQRKLSENLAFGLASSSMEVTLENEKVQNAASKYEEALGSAVDGKRDVVGFVFAVNGRPNSANIYASHDLFVQLWPKMLSSAAVEAAAEQESGEHSGPPTGDQVKRMLISPHGAKSERNKINDRLTENVIRYANGVRFETHDEKLGWTRAEILAEED